MQFYYVRDINYLLRTNPPEKVLKFLKQKRPNSYRNNLITGMMWPSQNFLLYNGTIIKIKVNEWINN